ncbi:MAG: hypothetical protein KC586_23230 [Myxococcales bacterium]|nr:hypothetical protein [Myxococcales bacterium]
MVVGVLVCASCASEPVVAPRHTTAASNEGPAHGEPSEAEAVAVTASEAETTPEPLEATTADEPLEATTDADDARAGEAREAPVTAPRTAYFTRVSFDLRSMPHRGPYDVDERLITSRVELLMQRARDVAGEPAPRLTYQPGVSVFRAEFEGPTAQAQCARVVAALATPPDEGPSRRASVRGVRATPCAPVDSEHDE